jgi:hypothetical protein
VPTVFPSTRPPSFDSFFILEKPADIQLVVVVNIVSATHNSDHDKEEEKETFSLKFTYLVGKKNWNVLNKQYIQCIRFLNILNFFLYFIDGMSLLRGQQRFRYTENLILYIE